MSDEDDIDPAYFGEDVNDFHGLSELTRDFWTSYSVPVLENVDLVSFLKSAVCEYHPVIIRGLIDDWPARQWDMDYLEEKIGKETSVDVNITSDGFADSIQSVEGESCFVYPLEHKMSFGMFSEMMKFPEPSDAVPYLSQQNDNLRTHFPGLLEDIKPSIELADNAFDLPGPEAVNLWIGDERSVSSLHKDHFENMYAVMFGEKTFTLFPPTDIAFIPEVKCSTRIVRRKSEVSESKQRLDKDDLEITTDGCPIDSLSWIPVDPDDPDSMAQHLNMRMSTPLRCRVRPGEVLYIPAMWYHRVSQSCLTIAVNYWYDQKFNHRYVLFSFVKNARQSENEGNQTEDKLQIA